MLDRFFKTGLSAGMVLFGCLTVMFMLVFSGSAQAGKPTISGLIKAYNPGGGRMQIQRDDGVIKNIIMRPGCQFMMNGQKVPSSAFRLKMRVCVRICGSVVGDPLECDLVADYQSSKDIVARHANTPNPTTSGGFAGTGGPAATLASVYNTSMNTIPNISGPLGIGGNFPQNSSSPIGDPTLAAVGVDPAIQNSPQAGGSFDNLADPANPYKQGTAAPGAVQPIGTTVGPGQYPGGVLPGSGNPANMGTAIATANNPYSVNIYDSSNPAGLKSTASLINTDDDEEEEDGSFMPAPSGPFSMQVVTFTGRVMRADAMTRSITVLPNGQGQPVQVTLHQMVVPVNVAGQTVQLSDVQPGMGISIQGVANSAGIIEARKVIVGQ